MDTQDAIYFLVTQYIQRQRLSLEVIQKYRPHLLDSSQRRPTKEYASATQMGYWGERDEWRYFLHGGGCRLTHTVTGESIDWDAPNLKRFDPYWFVGWLTWFLKAKPEHETASTILLNINAQGEAFQEAVFAVLEQLWQSGKLRYYPDRTNKYELVE